jgi:hypothetical protein
MAGYFPDRPRIFLLEFAGCGLTSLILCSHVGGYLSEDHAASVFSFDVTGV